MLFNVSFVSDHSGSMAVSLSRLKNELLLIKPYLSFRSTSFSLCRVWEMVLPQHTCILASLNPLRICWFNVFWSYHSSASMLNSFPFSLCLLFQKALPSTEVQTMTFFFDWNWCQPWISLNAWLSYFGLLVHFVSRWAKQSMMATGRVERV